MPWPLNKLHAEIAGLFCYHCPGNRHSLVVAQLHLAYTRSPSPFPTESGVSAGTIGRTDAYALEGRDTCERFEAEQGPLRLGGFVLTGFLV